MFFFLICLTFNDYLQFIMFDWRFHLQVEN